VGKCSTEQHGGRRSGYPAPLIDYAGRYGSAERTIKRWVRIGKDAKDLCPLDRAVEMPAWWSRRMKQRIPAEILAAAGGLDFGEDRKTRDTSVPDDLPELGPEDLTVEATLDRLQRAEARMGQRVLAASGQEMMALAKPWTDTAQRLTLTLKSYREEAVQLGKLVDKAKVDQALRELHAPIVRMLRKGYRTWCRVTGLPATADGEKHWQEAIDSELRTLQRELEA